MIESARFSHGQGAMQMQDLSKLDVNSFDGIIFPGGHGIIKNLWGTVKLSCHCTATSKNERQVSVKKMELWYFTTLTSLDPPLWRMAKTASCTAMWRECLKTSIVHASQLGMYDLVSIQYVRVECIRSEACCQQSTVCTIPWISGLKFVLEGKPTILTDLSCALNQITLG